MFFTSASGVRLPDVPQYIYPASPLHLSVVIITTIQMQYGLHPKYISTTTLEMYSTSISGAQLPDVAHYIYPTSPLQLSVVIITTIQMQFGLQPNIHENYISWLYTENTYISTTTEKMQVKLKCISTTNEESPYISPTTRET